MKVQCEFPRCKLKELHGEKDTQNTHKENGDDIQESVTQKTTHMSQKKIRKTRSTKSYPCQMLIASADDERKTGELGDNGNVGTLHEEGSRSTIIIM